jgi:hypothetical protein
MASTSFIKQAGIADDAAFRVLGLLISNALDTIGLIKTADTGQIDWATVTKPATYPLMAGYEIRQLPAGTLQTDNPVIVKISYGTGASATLFGMTFQFGHTTNGAGAFTGTASGTHVSYSRGNSTNGSLCFASCDEEHFSMALFCGIAGSTTQYYVICGVDRLRDADGVALSTGINVVIMGNTTPIQFILPSGAGAQFPSTPLAQVMALYPGGLNAPLTVGQAMCFSHIYPFMGCAGNPDMNFIVYPAAIMPLPGGCAMQFPVYGVLHTFILAGSYTSTYGLNSAANWSLGVRIE